MANNNLSYRLVLDGYGDRVVQPLGERGFRIQYRLSQDSGYRYAYDIVCSGALTFTGADFDWILGAEEGGYRCSDMYIVIQSPKCEHEDEDDSILPNAIIRLSDGEWDLDKCRVTIPVVPNDPNECWNLRKDDEINIFEASETDILVNLYDYTPEFEYNLSIYPYSPFSPDSQDFKWFPNRYCEYPSFGCENEIELPFYPESDGVLFIDEELKSLKRNTTTYHEVLSAGSTPFMSLFPTASGAFDAAALGWRLYKYRYVINATDDDFPVVMGYLGYWSWCREVVTVPTGTPMTADWIFIETSGSEDRYARPPILTPRTRRYFPSQNFPSGTGRLWAIQYEMTNYIIGDDTVITDANKEYPDDADDPTDVNKYGLKVLKNGVTLNSILEYAINHVCPDLTVKSDFFQINPDSPSSVNPVTGESSYTDNIVVFQKSDVKRPWASESATIGTFTPQQLIDNLCAMFKLRWKIDGNNFIIEHVSSDVFRKPYELDLTDTSLSKYVAGLRRYTYDISKLPAKETFTFQESRKQRAFLPDDDFAGVPIEYDGRCLNRSEDAGVLATSLSDVTNDIMFILLNSSGAEITDNQTSNSYQTVTEVTKSEIANSGFSFVATSVVSGDYYVVTAEEILSDNPIFNNVMGWAHLHSNFHTYEANAATGKINGSAVTFDSTRYVKKQVQLSIPFCCIKNFDPYKKVKTSLGEAIIELAEWEAHSNTLRLTLLYEL